MDQLSTTSPDVNQMYLIQKKLSLESSFRGGISWFYWIGGLSIINSLIYWIGGSVTFVVGLGVTQVIDGFTTVFAEDYVNIAATIRIVGAVLDLFFAGLFLGFGLLGRKRHLWAVITGMVLYGLDAVLLIFFKDWLGVAFHGLAVWGLVRGMQSLNKLKELEQTSPIPTTPLTYPHPGMSAEKTASSQMTLKLILIIGGIAIAVLLFVLGNR
ncbi:MAG: hypothetical protein ABFD24_04195 [Anaerolineaceae bacterium]